MRSEIYYLGKKINHKELANLYGETYAYLIKEEVRNCTESCSIESEDGALYIFVW